MSGKGSEARLTHGGDPRFRELVRAMDREYGERFGAAALKCRSCHGLDDIRAGPACSCGTGRVVACGAFRAMEEGTAERIGSMSVQNTAAGGVPGRWWRCWSSRPCFRALAAW